VLVGHLQRMIDRSAMTSWANCHVMLAVGFPKMKKQFWWSKAEDAATRWTA